MANNVPSTTMGKFGATYDINAINNMAIKAGLKPLSPTQLKGMSQKQVNQYLSSGKQVLKLNRKQFRKISRQARRNAKVPASENYRQAQLMHGTIRQGLAELGSIGSQGLAQLAFSRPVSSANAVQQNTDGGVTKTEDENGSNTEKGPVYAYRGRDEE